MRICPVVILMLSALISGCAGLGLPFTDYRLGDFPVEVSRKETNSSCINLSVLNAAALDLETRYLNYITSKDEKNSIPVDAFLIALGEDCAKRFEHLSVPQIKNELFGDIQTIRDSEKLRELGGYAFDYGDVSTIGGFEPSLHIRKSSNGPDHRMVAIYSLEDGHIIHFNYSGKDDVDRKSRTWPIDAILGIVVDIGVGAAEKAVVP